MIKKAQFQRSFSEYLLGRLAVCLMASFTTFTVAALASEIVVTSSDAEKIRQIDQMLQSAYKSTDPGAVILVSKNGKPLLRKAYGMANIEKGIALKADDVFRIGSITKPFTAMAILLLEEEGKLSLEDEITRFLPDYPMQGHKITIAHLLTHTSGLPIYTDMPNLRNAAALGTPYDVIEFFRNAPMLSAPGEQFEYNNSGYYLLGAVIEKVSGMSYAEFMAKRIFVPLGMDNTAFEGKERGAKRVEGYRVEGSRIALAPDAPTNITFSAGGLVSTADDMHRWQNAMASGKLLKPATWQRIFTPAKLNSGKPTEYGFGLTLRKLRGQPMREHSGVVQGFQAMAVTLPEAQISVVFLTNQQTRNNVARRMGEQIGAIAIGKPFPEWKPIALSEEALAKFEGTYQNDTKSTRAITRAGKQLRQQVGKSQVVLQSYADNAFFLPDGSTTRYRFEKNSAGSVTRMIRIDSGDEEEIFVRIGDAAPSPATDTLR